MYSSGEIASDRNPPSFVGEMGTSRAPGANSERKRFQFRFLPAGPEITSYAAARIAFGEETSAGLACGGVARATADFCAGPGFAEQTMAANKIARARPSLRTRNSSGAILRCFEAP